MTRSLGCKKLARGTAKVPHISLLGLVNGSVRLCHTQPELQPKAFG